MFNSPALIVHADPLTLLLASSYFFMVTALDTLYQQFKCEDNHAESTLQSDSTHTLSLRNTESKLTLGYFTCKQ